MSDDKLLRVTVEQIERMYALVPEESRTGATVIDALLARTLTPEEARRAAHTVARSETWDPGDDALGAKLGQIAGDR